MSCSFVVGASTANKCHDNEAHKNQNNKTTNDTANYYPCKEKILVIVVAYNPIIIIQVLLKMFPGHFLQLYYDSQMSILFGISEEMHSPADETSYSSSHLEHSLAFSVHTRQFLRHETAGKKIRLPHSNLVTALVVSQSIAIGTLGAV